MSSTSGIPDTIYSGGDIITMNDKNPMVEAVAVKNGEVIALGTKPALLQMFGAAKRIVDLQGKTMLPGFIDGHSHFFQAAMIADYVNVSAPPIGPGSSIAAIVGVLKEHAAIRPLRPGEWLIGYGYDGSALSDGREATREDFDQDFRNTPVVLIHVSGHGCVMNSAGFRKVGLASNTITPLGGFTQRKPGSNEPAGLLMENSWFPVAAQLPKPSLERMLANLDKAQQMYAREGYTTAQDAPVDSDVMPLYRKAAHEGRLYLDLNGYWESHKFLAANPLGNGFRTTQPDKYRLAGVTIIADGSPQGRTAYFTKPYLTGGPGGEKNWCGTPTIPQAHMNAVIKKAYEHGAQVMVHCNGDASIDMLLQAHREAGAPRDRRTTVIHSQFVRRDQLDQYVQLGISPCFLTNHAYFWGDVNVANLGQERAHFSSPMKTAREFGLHMTNHSDFRVTPLDTMFMLWTSVNRISRSGQVIGAEERISVLDALKALTVDGAYQCFEEGRKGTIEVGKLADFVILTANPTKVEPTAIRDIAVSETIKDGRSVYKRDGQFLAKKASATQGLMSQGGASYDLSFDERASRAAWPVFEGERAPEGAASYLR